MTEFKHIKQAIVEAQLASTPKDKMIQSIMQGTTELLSANDIIQKLGITTDEFQRLVDLPNHQLRNSTLGHITRFYSDVSGGQVELVDTNWEATNKFPKPDLYILGKARWTKETFKEWLEKQCK